MESARAIVNMMTEPESDFVYRLATEQEWRAAQETGRVPKRDIDERDGYYHLSTRSQLLETANLHFAGAADLLALKMPLAAIAGDVKFELAPKRGEKFPHLYGDLNVGHVAAAIRLNNEKGGFQFGDIL
ncbi:DUF952 domain-containing protein [Hyphococcus sp.]|uniref:DUF952 domain-containing protein n=1 Tax=Hyphococcus sp. TaxID=2038636 RepID=UPI003CCC355D